MTDLAHVLSLYAAAEAATAGPYSHDEDAPCGESIDHDPTDDGGECQNCGAELAIENDPHIAPETFMGVPVPKSLAHDWDRVHAIWWRYGVRAAVADIIELTDRGYWRMDEDTNPEEGIKE